MNTELFQHLAEAFEVWVEPTDGIPLVATPYLTLQGVEAFINALGEDAIRDSRWLVSLNLQTAASESTDPHAVLKLINLGAEVKTLDALHAKLYLLPQDNALILGSANLTYGGLERNQEIVVCTDDAPLASQARELFESWWTRGELLTAERCEEIHKEAEKLRAGKTAVMRLAELGAFVSITSSNTTRTRSIRWDDIGVPKPDSDDISSRPPTLNLWPGQITRGLDRNRDKCQNWVRDNGVEHNGGVFLPRQLFPKLEKKVTAANRYMADIVDEFTEDDWNEHRRSLEDQVQAWLEEIRREQNREEKWLHTRLESIMLAVSPPHSTDRSERPSVEFHLNLPHPDSGELSEMVNDLEKELAQHPINTQISFQDL